MKDNVLSLHINQMVDFLKTENLPGLHLWLISRKGQTLLDSSKFKFQIQSSNLEHLRGYQNLGQIHP
jgi:hypothetical protein